MRYPADSRSVALSDRRVAGPEGLRIAASRAGQNDDPEVDTDLGVDFELEPVRANGKRDRRPREERPRLRRAPAETASTVVLPPVVDDPVDDPEPDPEPAADPAPRPAPAVSVEPRRTTGRRPPAAASAARAKVLRQRRRRRRILIAVTGFTAFCTFLVGVVSVYVQSRLGQIKRVVVPNLAQDTHGAVMNVLLVGSDSRAGLDPADQAGFGADVVGGQRSDTMMLLHIDPTQEKAAIVSVPRDLYVPIANTNYSDRVNTAFALGGPDQLVATIQHTLGVTINHYVQVDFTGFKDIVETVGGVTIYLPYPVRDSGSGLDFGKSGCFNLTGQQALAWVRSRKMEFLINGTWQEDGRSDLGRIERQQDFIRRMMKKAISSGITNPIQLNRLIGIGVKDVTFDSALSTKDLTSLARRFSSLDPDRVVLKTLPTDPADIDGKAVLKLQTAQAQPMIDLLNGKGSLDVAPTTVAGTGATTTTVKPGAAATTPTTAAPAKAAGVTVRVLNGVGTAGAAAKAATALTSAGFTVADKGDAPALAPKTTITYATGQVAKAQALQSALTGPAVLKEDPTLKAVDVAIVVGADYTGVKAGATAGAGAAPTTAAPSTSTTLPSQINPVPLPKGTTTTPC